MATTLTKILLHVTFSTRGRANLIPAAVEPDLYAYMGGICRNLHSPLVTIGGTADHVHLLVSLAKTIAVSDLMLNLKRDSSKWMKDRGPDFSVFAWQEGYFAFSIGQSGVEAVRKYIANQKEHHRAVDFKTEVRMFLEKYEIEFDERYMWD